MSGTTSVEDNIRIFAGPPQRNGKRTVVALQGDEELLRDEVNTAALQARQRFAVELASRAGQPNRAEEFELLVCNASDEADQQIDQLENIDRGDDQGSLSATAILLDIVAD